MMRGQSGIGGNMQALAGVESRLAATLQAASDEVAHTECLDSEDRAEVYTILEAIVADTEVHHKTIQLLFHRLAEGGDA